MTRHPGALDKIRDLESPRVKVSSDPEVNYDHPTFTAHLANLEVAEKGTAVLECRVEPAKDPTMKIGEHCSFLQAHSTVGTVARDFLAVFLFIKQFLLVLLDIS